MYEPLGTRTIEAKPLIEALLKLINTREFLTNFDLRTIDQDDALKENDRILIGTTEGNQAISIKDFYFALLDEVFAYNQPKPPGLAKRMFFRGKNLGTEVTDEQWDAIDDGSFRGLFIGDYWMFDNQHHVIMDFDYFVGAFKMAHHLTMMPTIKVGDDTTHEVATREKFHDSYLQSKAHTDYIPNIIIPKLKGYYGESRLLEFVEFLPNVFTNTCPLTEGSVWTYKILAILPTESMMLGVNLSNIMVDHTDRHFNQLAGPMICSELVNPTSYTYWLRNQVLKTTTGSDYRWGIIDGNAKVGYAMCDNKAYIRPVYGICKVNNG